MKGVNSGFYVVLVIAVASIVMVSTVPVRPVMAALPVPQTIDLWAEKDAYVDESLVGTNFGGDSQLRGGYYTTFEFYYHRCILIQFDLSLLPVDAVITSANLRLTLHSGGGEDLAVKRVISSWDERYVTWSSKPSRSPSDPVTMHVGTSPLGQYSADVTTWAQGWFGETINNYGLWLEPEPYDEIGNACVFYSYEGAWVDPDPLMSALKHPKLRVSFESTTVVQQPPPPDPPPWMEDYTPPSVEITLDPSEGIAPDDEVTITVVARDDICLDQVELRVDLVLVERILIEFGVVDQTEVTIRYNTTFGFGDHHIHAMAKDRMSLTGGDYLLEHVGSRTPPAVTMEVAPSEVMPEDNSTISVLFRVTDSEGLRRVVVGLGSAVWDPDLYPDHCEVFEFEEPYPKTVSRMVSFNNLDVPGMPTPRTNATRVQVTVYALDIEGLSTTVRDNVTVARPYQWDYGIPYVNPSGPLSWQRYEDAFGHDELWGPGGLEWWKTVVARFWWPVFEMMGQAGQCFGMSMYSLWHHSHGIPVPDTLTEHVGDELPPFVPGYNEQNYAKRAIERWQGAQISQELLSQYIDQVADQLYASNPIGPFLAGPFQQLREDVENGRPGVLYMAEYRGLDDGVAECVGAHAVVPWLVVETAPNMWRVYVYDSNRPHTSTVHSTDYGNFEHYPFVVVTEDGFGWNHGGDNVWNDFIWYASYENIVRSDYDLMDGWLVTATVLIMIAVVVTAIALAGTVLVTVQALIPIPLPLPMGDRGVQGIALPLGEPYEVEILGQVDAEYSWAMSAGYSTYGINNKTCANGSVDGLGLGVGDDYLGYSMRFAPGVTDDDFSMGMAHRVGAEEREYLMEEIGLGADGDMQTYATADGESLVIANHGLDPIDLKVVFRSNRSNGQAIEDITVPAGKQVVITVDWDDLANSTVDVRTENIGGADSLLYVIVIVIGLVVIVAAAASHVLLRRRKAE